MKLRLTWLPILAASITFSVSPETTSQGEAPKEVAVQEVTAPAPIVSVIFSNESNNLENVFTLVGSGDFFGNKNAGIYYPEFVPAKGTLERKSITFDPGVLQRGPNVYPFMFTYKGAFYYLLFITSAILEEKTNFPFFASIIKVSNIQVKDKSAEIETIANLFFNQNDTLAIAFQTNRLAFGNVTTKQLAGFVTETRQQLPAAPQVPARRKVALQSNARAQPVVPVSPRKVSAPIPPKPQPLPPSSPRVPTRKPPLPQRAR